MEASVSNKVWKHYYTLFEKLSAADQLVAVRIGITQRMLVQLQNGRPIKNFSEKSISTLTRFLNAQIICNLIGHTDYLKYTLTHSHFAVLLKQCKHVHVEHVLRAKAIGLICPQPCR